MRISSEGNVGIGTTSPDGIFHVKTASAVHRSRFESGNSHSLVRLIAASSSNSGVEFYSGSTNTGNITGDSSSNLIFEPGGIARMSMNSTGTVFGDTSQTADGMTATPNDLNQAEMGPGYLRLKRDDTATAPQLTFDKNGSIHSYLETTSSGLNIVTTSPRAKYVSVNAVTEISESFNLAGNTTYNFDYTVPNEGGHGNSFFIIAGFNHFHASAYGAHRVAFVSTRGTSLTVHSSVINQTSTLGGQWNFTKPNATTLRIQKFAGTYVGSGSGFIKIFFRNAIG